MDYSSPNSIPLFERKNKNLMMQIMSFFTVFVCLFLCTNSVHGNTHSITVNISNVKPEKGNLVIALYNSSNTWLSTDKQFRVLSIPADKSEVTATFSGLPIGEYAVSMFQDENSNGFCDRSFFGIPTEKIGFSNNIVPRLFRPTFKECMIKAPSTISIQLVML